MKQVIGLLNRAFKDVNPSDSFTEKRKELRYPDTIWFCSNIFSFNPQDAHYLLPKLLINLCHSHLKILEEDEGVKTLLEFVGFVKYIGLPSKLDDFEVTHFGSEAARYANSSRSFLSEQAALFFSSYTTCQAKAILAWLNVAQGWVNLYIFQDDLQKALCGWETFLLRNVDKPT